MLACVQRIIFLMDPIRGWLFPYYWQQLFITWSAPTTFSAMILLVFYWQDAIDTSNVKVASIITRSKIPAIVACLILFITEISTSSLRISYALGDRSQTISVTAAACVGNEKGVRSVSYVPCRAVFAIIIGLYCLYFIYVTIRVFLFLRRLPGLSRSQKQLRSVTIRACMTLAGIVIVLVGAIIIITPIYYQPVAHTFGHFFMYAAGLSNPSRRSSNGFSRLAVARWEAVSYQLPQL